MAKKRKLKKQNHKRTIVQSQTTTNNYVKYGLSTLLVAILAAAYPMLVDYYQDKLTGNLVLTLEKHLFMKTKPNYVFYPISDQCKNKRLLIPIDVQIHNKRNEVDEDVSISFKYNWENQREDLANFPFHAMGRNIDQQYSHQLNVEKMVTYANTSINYISPLGTQGFSEAAFASKVDENIVKFYTIENGLDIKVMTHSKKTQEQEWELLYRGMHANSSKELIPAIQFEYARKTAWNMTHSGNYFDYFYNMIFADDVKVYIAMIDLEYSKYYGICYPNEKHNREGEHERYIVMEFDPYTFDNLWLRIQDDYRDYKAKRT